MKKQRTFTLLGIGVMMSFSAGAAILNHEDFSTDPGGTYNDRDGFLTVAYDGLNEYITADFAFDPFNSPQTDAIVVTDSNYTGSYSGITQITFDLYAVSVLPSDLFIRFVDGASTMAYQISSLGGMLGSWATFTIDLVYSASWGVNQATFDNILASVDQVEIQLTRSGGSAQEFRLDNLQTLDTAIGGGGPSAIPEPTTMSFIAVVVASLVALRRRLHLMRSA